MKSINPNLYPKTGYMFSDTDGARIFATTWAGVIARVAGYRKRSGRAVGDVQAEVVAQACEREPSLCHEGASGREPALQKATLKARVLTWFSSLRSKRAADGALAFASEETAKGRADICAGCPFNNDIRETCAPCKAVVQEFRGDILGKRFQDSRLKFCLVLGEDCVTAIHLETPTVPNDALPAVCWRKRTL